MCILIYADLTHRMRNCIFVSIIIYASAFIQVMCHKNETFFTSSALNPGLPACQTHITFTACPRKKGTKVEYLCNHRIKNHNCFTTWSGLISHSIWHLDGSCTSKGHCSWITQMHPTHHFINTYFSASAC